MSMMTNNRQGKNGSIRTAGRAVAVSAVLLATVTAASLAAAATTPQASVRYERGELASGAGVEQVHARVMRAAEQACRMHGVRDLARKRQERECREEMVSELLAAIDSERLDGFHASRRSRGMADAG